MNSLLASDTALFRFINQSLVNPVFDWLMPKLAGHKLFIPGLLILGVLLLWKGGRRARVLVFFLALGIAVSDGLVSNNIKKAIGRPRPCIALADTRCLIGCTTSGSMPSAHAANWFAGAMVCFIFYRRTWRVMAPAAAIIAFARVYDGVHYPSDVIAGAIFGAGSALGTVWSADALWRWLGQKWFPLWWRKLPSLLQPELRAESGVRPSSGAATSELLDAVQESSDPSLRDPPTPESEQHKNCPTLSRLAGRTRLSASDTHWLRLGYVLIAAWLLFRLGYLASGVIELSKDEAYQWLWSKHLALSYYSKPPGIAFIQFAGTPLWGDTQFGVRFFSPIFAAILSLVMLRFLGREAGGRQS